MGLPVIPAVDLLGTEAVRLERGSFSAIAVRERDPLGLVARMAGAGAGLIHVVDLDGARTGRIRPDLIERVVAAAAPARVQASGGIRSIGAAKELLARGVARVVVGTSAFANEESLSRYAAALEDRLVVALDVRHGRVAVRGWEDELPLGAEEAAERCRRAGVARVVCTSIERDGTLEGPDVELLPRVAGSGLAVIAAGGIASQAHLAALSAVGCEAAIVGRALLEGLLPLSIVRTRITAGEQAVGPGKGS